MNLPHASVKQRIALLRFSSLGDLVTMEPRLRAIRAFHPGSTFVFITSAIGRELYGSEFNECVLPEDTGASKWRQARNILAAIPDRRFDFVYDLQGATVSLLVALGLRAGRRVYQSTRPWQKLLGLKDKGKDTMAVLAAAGFGQDQIDAYFTKPASKIIQLRANAAQTEAFMERFAQAGSGPRRAVLAMGASENWKTKHWGEQNYLALAESLHAAGFTIVLVGSGDEKAMAVAIKKRIPATIDLTGATSIGELKAVLALASVFIGNDSGPAHIAAGMGVPTVTIFGPTSTVHGVKHFPYHGTHVCMSPEGLACHPCYKKDCDMNHACMAKISASAVLEHSMAIARNLPDIRL